MPNPPPTHLRISKLAGDRLGVYLPAHLVRSANLHHGDVLELRFLSHDGGLFTILQPVEENHHA